MRSNRIVNTDCLGHGGLPAVPDGSVHLVVVDPPYNIGFDYGDGEYDDKQSPETYAAFCTNWIRECYRVLSPTGSCYIVIGDEWLADLTLIARAAGFHLRSHLVWYYTFGVNSPKKFTRSHAHILYLVKHKKNFTFNYDQIRVPSARAAVYNDPRANPEGRLPDDTWILRPQELPQGFAAESDTWYISRVCGTFKERQKDAKNQLPEQLVGRIIRASSNPGDLVLDPMCGTGTVPAVAKKLGRTYLGFEMSAKFAGMATQRVTAVQPGQSLDGPIPHGG